MAGDYSRFSFDPEKDYSSVLKQQGRVSLDSDWNEAQAIADRRLRAETIDLMGATAVPETTPDAFKIIPDGKGSFTIGCGRMYVDGLLVECHGYSSKNSSSALPYDAHLGEVYGPDPLAYSDPTDRKKAQPYYYPTSSSPLSNQSEAIDLVYLKVWQREVTVIADPDIKEIALGGADTTTRLQTVWQVRVLPLDGKGKSYSCSSEIPGWKDETALSEGRLSTSVVTLPASDDPCSLSPIGGYRGLENRLYRVEIHQVKDKDHKDNLKFKWSRDNGSIVASVEEIRSQNSSAQLVINQLGRDQKSRFQVGDWVEVLDDAIEFDGVAGVIAKVSQVDEAARLLTLDRAIDSTFPSGATNPARHTRVRRWDQKQNVDNNGLLDAVMAQPIELEDGIQVTFDLPKGNFKVGDYWVFAARTADHSVEKLNQAPPYGILYHYARLALIKAGQIEDCRRHFSPMTEMISFFYLGGDGQETMPGQWLAQPLQVGVANGLHPIKGAKVRFSIEKEKGEGKLRKDAFSQCEDNFSVSTNENGIATCYWLLDSDSQHFSQQVKAELLDPQSLQPTHLPIHFTANLSIAAQVEYDPHKCDKLQGVTTVQDAIDGLCKQVSWNTHFLGQALAIVAALFTFLWCLVCLLITFLYSRNKYNLYFLKSLFCCNTCGMEMLEQLRTDSYTAATKTLATLTFAQHNLQSNGLWVGLFLCFLRVIIAAIVGYLAGFLLATLYNRFNRKSQVFTSIKNP